MLKLPIQANNNNNNNNNLVLPIKRIKHILNLHHLNVSLLPVKQLHLFRKSINKFKSTINENLALCNRQTRINMEDTK